MYLLKHICQDNSVTNQLIVALVLTTSACLSSFTTEAGIIHQPPVVQGSAISANNGHGNTNLFFSDIAEYNKAVDGIQPLALLNCNVMGSQDIGAGMHKTARQVYPTMG